MIAHVDGEDLGVADLDRIRADLLASAYLFDDPSAYAAGIEDAITALAARRPERAGRRTVGAAR